MQQTEIPECQMTLTHKETFFQPANDGIPSYWVVQYYVNNNPFCEAQYFKIEAEAQRFEWRLKENNSANTK